MKKYLKYTIEDLIGDKSFIDWVNHGKNSDQWHSLIKNNSEFSLIVQEAREIVILLCRQENYINEKEISDLWNCIYESHKSQNRRKFFNSTLIFSSIAFIFFGLIYFSYNIIFNLHNNVVDENISIFENEYSILKFDDNESIKLYESNNVIDLYNSNTFKINDSLFLKKDIQLNNLVVSYGKTAKVILEDSTVVYLNSGSSFSFPLSFSEFSRDVYLEGEGFFDVKNINNSPFNVHVNDHIVKVLGTIFNIQSYANDDFMKTVLVNGKINILFNSSSELQKEISVKERDLIYFQKANAEISVEDNVDVNKYMAWINGWYYYDKENLNHVFKQLERYYNIKINYSNNFNFDDQISGKLFLSNKLQDVLDVLSLTSNFTYVIDDKTCYVFQNE